jgi:hypothetical protein
MAVYNDELVKLDPDWIIICPCGLDIQVRKGPAPHELHGWHRGFEGRRQPSENRCSGMAGPAQGVMNPMWIGRKGSCRCPAAW